MCLLFHYLCLLFPTASVTASPESLGRRQLNNIFDQGALAVTTTSTDAASTITTKEHGFLGPFLAKKEEDPAATTANTALLFQQRQSGADGTSDIDANQNATETVSVTDANNPLSNNGTLGNVTTDPTSPPNTTTMAPTPSYVLAVNSSFVVSIPATTGANGTMPAFEANGTTVLDEEVMENLTKAYAALSLSVVFGVNGQILEANRTAEDNDNTNNTDTVERVRERRFLRAALPLPAQSQKVGNRRLAEVSDLNATVNYVSSSAILLGSFPRLSCPEGTADEASCLTVFAQYEVTVQDSEDSQTVYDAFVAETQSAIDDGELQQSLEQVDPDSVLVVEGSSEPVSLPAFEATAAPSEPIETAAPTTGAPTTIAPTTGSSGENSENEDDDNDDGGVDGVMLGLIIAISVTAVIIGILAAAFCYLRRKTPTAESEDKGLNNVEGASAGEEGSGTGEKDPEAQQHEDAQPMEHHPGDDADPDDDDSSDWPSSHGDLFSEEEQNELNESNASNEVIEVNEVNERDRIEKLVSEKCPEEQENIEDLLDQFKGRESSLIATLENMEEVDREIEKDESENQDGEPSVHDESPDQHAAPLAMEDSDHAETDEVNSMPTKEDSDTEDPLEEEAAVSDTDGEGENEASGNPRSTEDEIEANVDESKALGAGAVLLAAAAVGKDESDSEEEDEKTDASAGGDDDDSMGSQPETKDIAVESENQKEDPPVESDGDLGDDNSDGNDDESNSAEDSNGGDDESVESQPEAEDTAVAASVGEGESDTLDMDTEGQESEDVDVATTTEAESNENSQEGERDADGSNSAEDTNQDSPEEDSVLPLSVAGTEEKSESQEDGGSDVMDTSTDVQESNDEAPMIEVADAVGSNSRIDQSEETTMDVDTQKENDDNKNEVEASTKEEKDAADSVADVYAGSASIDGGESKDPRDLDSSDDFDWGDEESVEGDKVAQRGGRDDDTAESGGDIYARSDSIDEGDTGVLGGDKESRDLESSDDDIDWDEEGSGDESDNSDDNGAEKWEEGDKDDDEDWEDGEGAENIDESAGDNLDESEDWSE